MKCQIFDTTCILPYGHNFPALLRYSGILDAIDVINTVYVCSGFPLEFSENCQNVVRVLPHAYGLGGHPLLSDPVKETKKAFLNVIDNTHDNTVFFPNIDAVSIIALVEIFSEHEIKSKFILRLIGVMENDFVGVVDHNKALNSIKKLVDVSNKNNIDLVIGCETKEYSDLISFSCGKFSEYMPFPLTNKFSSKHSFDLNINVDRVLNVGCLGAASTHKGYFSILGLIENYNCKYDQLNFVIQPECDNGNKAYLESLKVVKNIQLTRCLMNHDELLAAEQSCNVFLLPYLGDIYKYRGSAMLFEGMEYGIPSVTHSGVGFAREMLEYQTGYVYDDLTDCDFDFIKNDYRNRQSAIANYINYTNDIFKNLFAVVRK